MSELARELLGRSTGNALRGKVADDRNGRSFSTVLYAGLLLALSVACRGMVTTDVTYE